MQPVLKGINRAESRIHQQMALISNKRRMTGCQMEICFDQHVQRAPMCGLPCNNDVDDVAMWSWPDDQMICRLFIFGRYWRFFRMVGKWKHSSRWMFIGSEFGGGFRYSGLTWNINALSCGLLVGSSVLGWRRRRWGGGEWRVLGGGGGGEWRGEMMAGYAQLITLKPKFCGAISQPYLVWYRWAAIEHGAGGCCRWNLTSGGF